MTRTLSLLIFFLVVHLYGASAHAGISAKLVRYVDVSDDRITFVYGGDVWLMPKTGGQATRLTSSPGEESWPRFSPDGQSVAYTASYAGNEDVYVVPVTGGVPTRLTWNSFSDRVLDWHPDGERVLFASARELGQRSAREFFLVSRTGGMPEKLAVPYGELASYSPDGSKLAYITKITENYPFKRYRGGLTSDIIVHDLETETFERITDDPATDGKPAWGREDIYFLSDQGPNLRLNVWRYDTSDQSAEQLTTFTDFDVAYLAAGPSDVVFEAGGVLYLMNQDSHEFGPIDVEVVSDLSAEMPRTVQVGDRIASMSAAPGGKRVVFEARGELFDVPVEEGYTLNLTQSSGAFDQQPAWSPDGEHLAFWSDRSGEYEIHLRVAESGETRKLTSRGEGFGYSLHWSPDGANIGFIDHKNAINVVDVESGEITEVGHTNWQESHGARYGYPINWSPDSRWLAFRQGLENAHYALVLWDRDSGKSYQATSGFYSDGEPVFSTDGQYLFYLTDRSFTPAYSDLDDGTWIYPNATQIAAVSLTGDAPSLLAPRNDAFSGEDEESNGGNGEAKSKDKEGDEEGDKKKQEPVEVEIDFDGLEARLVILPPRPGNFGGLYPLDGKLAYLRFPNTGAAASEGGPAGTLAFYDFEEREEKTILEGVASAQLTADGKALLVSTGQQYAILKPEPEQKIETPIPTDGLEMDLVPRAEWRQIFADTWRRHRDMFYDPTMHQLDWAALRDRYAPLIEHARTRWDVTNVQSNLAAELSAGHTYTGGGDVEQIDSRETGFLGIDWTLEDGAYRISRIIRPAAWDTAVRSPFDRPGVDVKAGDVIHSVNGAALDAGRDPYAPFDGLSGKTVVLEVSRPGGDEARQTVVVQALTQGEERELRYLAWIEANRRMVETLSDGKLGYVYMSNTSTRGQLELVRMYYGQLDKQGFVIDERFNGGGQLADRFLELLTRPVVYNLHWRNGRDHTWPTKTNTGPMGMLINGWAGSGGDGLPWAFQELEAGPIVGERTLGILIGPATGHTLVDGGRITVPDARLYDNDGHWFWEGEGVRPDIPVWDDPNLLAQGRDPQIERVVEEVLKAVEANPPKMTPTPPLEDRTVEGLR